MPDNDQHYVFAAIEVSGAEMIDGGRTLAIRFQKAVVLLSLPLAEDLNRKIAEVLQEARGVYWTAS